MPRTKQPKRDQQIYKLAQYGAIVTIDYDANRPPPFFQPGPGVVIVGDHVCGPAPAQQLPQQRESGPSLGEIREFQRRREEQTPVRKPFTSEDAAREAGFPAAALSFEALSGVAAQMNNQPESIDEKIAHIDRLYEESLVE